jgi:hypothetical protein
LALTRSTIPKLAEGLALTSLPLGPMEGYVLSRIDGRTDLATLGSMIGLGESELFAASERCSCRATDRVGPPRASVPR